MCCYDTSQLLKSFLQIEAVMIRGQGLIMYFSKYRLGFSRIDCQYMQQPTCQSYVSILSYCPTWDIGRTSQGFPCGPFTCQSYVSILSYCPTWDIGRISQGFPCGPLTCQSYVSILSYCPTRDIGRTSQGFPCGPLTCQSCVYPILLSHMGHR